MASVAQAHAASETPPRAAHTGLGHNAYFPSIVQTYWPLPIWSAIQPVYDGAQLCGDTQLPDVAMDATGNAYAVWADCRNLQDNDNYDIYFSWRPAGGDWSSNTPVSLEIHEQTRPVIALDGNGGIHVAWIDERAGRPQIYAAYQPAGGSWQPEERVSDNAASLPSIPDLSIAADAAGDAYIAWTDQRNNNAPGVYVAYRPRSRQARAGQATYSGQANVRVGNGNLPAIAVDDAGNGYLAWLNPGWDWLNDLYYAYMPAGGDWTEGVRINQEPGKVFGEQLGLAADVAGNVYAAWVGAPNGANTPDIYFATRPAGGSWGAAVNVTADGSTIREGGLDLGVDARGNATALWTCSNSRCDVYAASRTAEGSWGSANKINDLSPQRAPADPRLAIAANGAALAIWEDFRADYAGDIFASSRSASGSWDTNGIINDDAGSAAQSTPALAVDPSGNAYALWQDMRGDLRGDIYFALRPVGSSWGVFTKVNDDNGSATQRSPGLAVDPAGGAYAIWADQRNGKLDIYFAYRPAGGPWGANERVNDISDGALRYYPAISIDSAGNAYALWNDTRGGQEATDIYFAYRPAGGRWGTNLRINDVAGSAGPKDFIESSWPALAVDGAGNVWAAWRDFRDGTFPPIYAAFHPAGGGWQASERVSNDGYWESCPTIALDNQGGIYAAWERHGGDYSTIRFSYRPPGGAWQSSVQINGSYPTGVSPSTSAPQIVVDVTHTVYVIWRDWRSPGPGLYFDWQRPGGLWHADVPVALTRHGLGGSALAVDRNGRLYAAWQDYRNITPHIYSAEGEVQ